jgi:hypothetical protein
MVSPGSIGIESAGKNWDCNLPLNGFEKLNASIFRVSFELRPLHCLQYWRNKELKMKVISKPVFFNRTIITNIEVKLRIKGHFCFPKNQYKGPMTIINQLASALNRRDEVPNQELAGKIVATGDKKAIRELMDNLGNKSRDIQSDCIKVLYEIGEKEPGLIAGHASDLVALLDNKNNRLQWGAMTALDSITLNNPAIIYKALTKIIATAEKGSVITTDHAVNILIKLCSIKEYEGTAFPLLIEQLLKSPTNQLPMYAERALPVINSGNKALFVKTLSSRLDDIEKDTKRKRVEKVIRKLGK